MRALAAGLALSLVGGCGGAPSKEAPPAPKEVIGVAKLTPKNGSTVRGLVSFRQRGDKVDVAGDFFELFPGPHSLYIHEVGNCSSPNAASAGPVWNLPGTAGDRRTGDLVQLSAGTQGYAVFSYTLTDISVATGK